MWPGYDLSGLSLLIYRPGEWALVLNPKTKLDGSGPYPASWPRLGVPAILHIGPTPGLVGQLELTYLLGREPIVAIPIPNPIGRPDPHRARSPVAFIVHEAFHGYQRAAFHEANELSDEEYPILDATNSARAALEMRTLGEALAAVQRGDRSNARRWARMFLAERRFR